MKIEKRSVSIGPYHEGWADSLSAIISRICLFVAREQRSCEALSALPFSHSRVGTEAVSQLNGRDNHSKTPTPSA